MLTHLYIRNFAIVEKLEVNFTSGLNIITGESGAGKSIILKALGAALGKRCPADSIRPNCEQLEVIACFDISSNGTVKSILSSCGYDLQDEDLIIKRIVSANGKSKCYINDRPATTTILKEIANNLIDIHSQHQQYQIQKSQHQLHLLDCYGKNQKLLNEVQSCYQKHKELVSKKADILKSANQDTQLLEYQVKELEEFAPQEGEYEQVSTEHEQAAKSQDIKLALAKARDILEDNDKSITENSLALSKALDQVVQLIPSLKSCQDILSQVDELLAEIATEIDNKLDSVNDDPEHCNKLDKRLSSFHTIARKHNVKPEEVFAHFINLTDQLTMHQEGKKLLESINREIANCESEYYAQANLLSESRIKTASKLEKKLKAEIAGLGLQKADVKFEVTKTDIITSSGIDNVEIKVTTNPGQPLQPIAKVASGGELARISLGLSAITAGSLMIPSLILDEIDTGVSGKIAALVGETIYQLANKTQILCITHHPNVAAQPGTHWHISKNTTNKITTSKISKLDRAEREKKIAELISGDTIESSATQHARELLGETQ